MKPCSCFGKRLRYWMLVGTVLLLWSSAFFQPFAHCPFGEEKAEREKVSIEAVLDKKHLTDRDYAVIFQQTGLGKLAVEQIRARQNYTQEDILIYQKYFLGSLKTQCEATSAFTRQDKVLLDQGKCVPMAPLEDGDILLSFSSHSLNWRHGHAGLVVNAKEGLCLEAVMPGCVSKINSINHWHTYSSFLILRLKDASRHERKDIASYAAEHLKDIPYSLTSGVLGEKTPKERDNLKAQCAYLIWYAFLCFGYDLDSDGGKLVTVEDIKESPLLEIVQCFGMEDYRKNKTVKINQ